MLTDPDRAALRARLHDYLRAKGVTISRENTLRCFEPSRHTHGDEHPSAVLYDENVYCPVCAKSWDIFEAAGYLGGAQDFPAKVEEIQRTLGLEVSDGRIPGNSRTGKPNLPRGGKNTSGQEPAKASSAGSPKPVSVSVSRARELYTKETLTALAQKMRTPPQGPLAKVWLYKDASGQVAGLDARFEWTAEGTARKAVITYWYDGQHVRSAGAPVMLYGLDALAENPDLPVCIHEGAKCAAAAAVIGGFIHLSWSGGSSKTHLADWSPLAGRTVYLYPDADEPGYKAVRKIKEILDAQSCAIKETGNDASTADELGKSRTNTERTRVKICAPLQEAVERYGAGADIVEALQICGPAELADYIRDGPVYKEVEDALQPIGIDPGLRPAIVGRDRGRGTVPKDREEPRGNDDLANDQQGNAKARTDDDNNSQPADTPFRILGIADDQLIYFLDDTGRQWKWAPNRIHKDELLTLTAQAWWTLNYPQKHGIDWDTAIDDIRQIGKHVTFDPERIRGRGAWKYKDRETGTLRLCYHDGEDTIGDRDPCMHYLKRTRRDIGLGDAPASPEVRREMLLAASELSFETRADAIRLLGWSVLAPFCGALPWRPTGFITGKSQSGKTTALNLIARPLSLAETCSGAASTEAGIRQHNKTDAIGIIIEELEDDTKEKRENRNRILSFERLCTSDDAPPGWKGTVEGQGMQFGTEKMFLNVGISPMIDESADENRMFMISMTNREDSPEEWHTREARCEAAYTEDKCRGVRAYTWAHLAEIIAYAKTMRGFVHRESNHSTRYSYLEAILFSAYWIVFQDRIPSEDEAMEFLAKRYAERAPEHIEDESEKMVSAILDTVLQLEGSRGDHITVGQILRGLRLADDKGAGGNENDRMPDINEARAWRRTATLAGVYLDKAGNLGVFKNYAPLQRLLGANKYFKMLEHHPLFMAHKNATAWGAGTKTMTFFRAELLATDELPF